MFGQPADDGGFPDRSGSSGVGTPLRCHVSTSVAVRTPPTQYFGGGEASRHVGATFQVRKCMQSALVMRGILFQARSEVRGEIADVEELTPARQEIGKMGTVRKGSRIPGRSQRVHRFVTATMHLYALAQTCSSFG